jgi:hypothetical protein
MSDGSSHHEKVREHDGGERGEGRPSGLTESSRPAAEGRPTDGRHADAMTRPDAEEHPTEDVVDRGGTPDTEHQPGGDL